MQMHGKQIKDSSIREYKLDIQDNISMNYHEIINLSDPTDPKHAATKAYVDSIAQGLLIKEACKTATTTPLGTGYDYFPTNSEWTTPAVVSIGGIELNDGDRVLIKNETGGNIHGHGIWQWDASTRKFHRAPDADNVSSTSSEVKPGMYTFIRQGELASTGWVLTETDHIPAQLETDYLNFVQFSGGSGSTYYPGEALHLDGNIFNVIYDDNTIGLTTGAMSNRLCIKDFGVQTINIANDAIDKTKINSDVAGTGIKQNNDGSLESNVDDITIGLTTNTPGGKLYIKNGGVQEAQIANNSITIDKLNINTIIGNGLTTDPISHTIVVTPTNTSIDISSSGVSAATLYYKTFNANNISGTLASHACEARFGTELSIPATTSEIMIYVNGVLESFVWETTDGMFFIGPEAQTARSKGNISNNDYLYFNPNFAEYELENTDKITIAYSVVQ